MSFRPNQERHMRACEMFRHVLTLGSDVEAWSGLATVLAHRLTPFERACLLVSVIGAMDSDEAQSIVGSIYNDLHARMPLPPFLDPTEDATWWASVASIEERKSVLVAAFLSLPERDQDSFLDQARRRVAA